MLLPSCSKSIIVAISKLVLQLALVTTPRTLVRELRGFISFAGRIMGTSSIKTEYEVHLKCFAQEDVEVTTKFIEANR